MLRTQKNARGTEELLFFEMCVKSNRRAFGRSVGTRLRFFEANLKFVSRIFVD